LTGKATAKGLDVDGEPGVEEELLLLLDPVLELGELQ